MNSLWPLLRFGSHLRILVTRSSGKEGLAVQIHFGIKALLYFKKSVMVCINFSGHSPEHILSFCLLQYVKFFKCEPRPTIIGLRNKCLHCNGYNYFFIINAVCYEFLSIYGVFFGYQIPPSFSYKTERIFVTSPSRVFR